MELHLQVLSKHVDKITESWPKIRTMHDSSHPNKKKKVYQAQKRGKLNQIAVSKGIKTRI